LGQRERLRQIDVLRAGFHEMRDRGFDFFAAAVELDVCPLQFLIAFDECLHRRVVAVPFGAEFLLQRRRHGRALHLFGELFDPGFDIPEVLHVAAEQVVLLMPPPSA
jgi:hypothetical protein